MKYLQYYIVTVILLVFFSSCSTLPLLNKKTPKNRISIIPTAHAASELSDIEKIFGPVNKFPKTGPVSHYIKNYATECIALAALLLVLFFYHLQQAKFQRIKHYKLDDDEMALFGLAVDTLVDLWHRIQAKTRCRIIPFPRRG